MEIEIKAKVKNLQSVRNTLRKMKIRRVKKVRQIDEYYSLYKRPFSKKVRGKIVRVRHHHGETQGRFEFHISRSTFVAEEYEVTVGDVKMLRKILQMMKAKKEAVVDKEREYYQKGKLEITLDKVKGLGTFVEVEIQGKDTKANLQKLMDFLTKLGVTKDQYWTTKRYGAEMCKKKGLKHAYF